MEEDVMQLQKIVEDLAEKYNQVINLQEKNINDIDEIEQKLLELENEKNDAQHAIEQQKASKEKNKKLLQNAFKKTGVTTLISSLIVSILNIFLNGSFIVTLPQFIILFLVNSTANMIPYFYFKTPKVIDNGRTVEEIDKEYNEIKNEKRIKNNQHVKLKVLERIIEAAGQTINNELISIQENQKSIEKPDEIKLNDIYFKLNINQTFQNTTSYSNIINRELKEYLQLKVSQFYPNLLSKDVLKLFSNEELLTIIAMHIPEEQKNDKLSHIIHAMLGLISNAQGYSVTWYEEKDEKFIEHPEIIYDEQGRILELKTHRLTDYIKLFTYISETIDKENNVIKKQKQLFNKIK
jgi:hypothetical protein